VYREVGPGAPPPVAIERVWPSGDGLVLDVTYMVGVRPCSWPAGVTVEETATEVRLTARMGHGDGTCTSQAIPHTERVALAAPLGTRTVVDETTGREVPVRQ